ncbi:bifunctional sensory photoreceptor [Volvox carteri f. nagariensis]|uniref:Bifunctional sensory photoreceptor n=2 Tax=Volvox carteri TaxID=3067 RepID=A0A125YIA1_VOLCA|nr:bifunctional sensory photoreceptor [Volvox carteri f. nagariensis]EFJ45181.1 bifunctional sensory photoreceptor [Volvox carteri f. nagariensis]CAA72088.1 volvoxopsin [Volvox carteri f. nagariensis]CAA93259.1 volvoxopsin [Volvox carteri f. nagariensis]|eukprot:XP_002953857.1 bifunctional sensory photoreceptor [Volvox carteri f. nagariensis]
MADLKNLGAEYDVTKKTLKSSCKFKVADSVGVKLKLTSPANALNVEVDGKNWGITYDVVKKDLELKGEWKLKGGEFKIKQKVPGLKTELLPSPEVQWKQHVVKNKKFAWEVEPSYCFQARLAKLEQTVEFNGGKQKLKLETDSKAGVKATVGTLSAKVGNSWAKQLSVKYSKAAGPSLTHEVEPSNKVSLKSTVGIKARDLKIVAEVKPGKVAGVKPKLTLEGKVTAKAPLQPSGIIAGLSFDV